MLHHIAMSLITIRKQLKMLEVSIQAEKPRLSTAAWSGRAAQWGSAKDYCAACLDDRNEPGKEKTKDKCRFPYIEPVTGNVNLNALRAIQAGLLGGRGGITATDEEKAAIGKKLLKVMRDYDVDPAPELLKLVGGKGGD